MKLKQKQEEKEQKRTEKSEACLYTIIKVSRDEDLGEQMTFTKFKEEVAKAFGVPVQFQRYWLWAERKNHTYRPYRTLTAQEEIQPVGQLREVSNKENNAELELFLEVELCLDLRPFPPQEKIKEDVLLFFKLYDPLIEKIRYVGRLFVKESDKPLDVLTKINELAGFSADEEIELFEEIKFEPHVVCENIDSNMSFRECVIGDGDIICFQKSIRNQCSEQYRFPEVPLYLDYVLNRQIRLRKEQEEKEQKRKEGEEARLYTIIKVARDEDLGEQIGKEIYFDLVDHDKVRAFHILKQMPFTQFKEEVARTFGTPVKFQRYWLWEKRENSTYRPYRALTAQEEIQSVGELRDVSNKGNSAEIKLFLEVELCLDLRPLSPPGKVKEVILLFFKLYDPLEEKIRYVGRMFVNRSSKLLEILTKLNELAGFLPDEEIDFFEEINFEPNVICEHIDSNTSFCDCEMGDGDIICFQKSLRNQCGEQYRFPKVPSFLEYVHSRQRLKKEQEEKEQQRKDKTEARFYQIIKVARDEDIGEQIGKEIYFDLVDHDKVRTFRIQKQMQFIQFKEEVAKEFGIAVQFQRFWLWQKRQNHSYRPHRALKAQEEIQSVSELREGSNKGNDVELKLYLQVDLCLNLRPFAPPGKTKEEILIFFKLYDPLKENIRYIGRLSVKGSGKLQDILSKLKEFAGISPNEEIELYKEINFEPSVMCEKIDNMLSFSECQLEDGDIICFQKSLQNQCIEQYRFPEVPSFLEYVHNHQQKEHKMLASGSDFPTKRPEPHEVTPTDTASTVAPQDVDDAESTRFTWTVDNFSTLNVKLYSDVFSVGGCKWRILMFPKGNNTNHLSIYLDAADAASLPSGWSSYAEFSLAVLDQVHGEFTVRKDTKHMFDASMDDWGFTSFLPLIELHDPGRGYLVDDKVILEAVVSMPKSH
ncbi:ubiquitin C-terminal hydrolase 12-like isoform X2 [Capsicum annuum]|uniref:ubiquitin C-terminal hydrolase 12-like isoform X2 n=1 Tax=Capsicum annuum TaxID=4072 RepID=UPI001FB09430|nr:ubiquitin C-terminal hydrolase 12-like isoform X2 [Capsicum annuum]